jgi:hypothetical protein
MSNTSATGGYLVPSSNGSLPGGLTLNQFIQTVLVGVSGITGSLVRPRWQAAPPANPDLSVNWIAFGVTAIAPDANAYTQLNVGGASAKLQRQELLEVQCAFYGPSAMEIAGQVRDAFQLQQNLEALQAGNVTFAYTGDAQHIPDLVNERWIDRVEMSIFLRRQRDRTYPVLQVNSAEGTIHAASGEEEYLVPWSVEEES